MEPIRYELVEDPVFLESEEALFDGVVWEPEEFSNYMPEFLEESYDGPNAEKLKAANKRLEYYMNHKSEYQYIASYHIECRTDEMYVEYYYIDDDTIISFLSSKPHSKNPKYYRVLEATMLYKKLKDSFVM